MVVAVVVAAVVVAALVVVAAAVAFVLHPREATAPSLWHSDGDTGAAAPLNHPLPLSLSSLADLAPSHAA